MILSKSDYNFDTTYPDDLLHINLDEKLDKTYSSLFNEVTKNINTTKIINKNFKDFKVIFLILTFWSAFFYCILDNASLTFLMETSVNDNCIYWNYHIYWLGKYSSFIFTYILLIITDSYHYPILIAGIFTLVCFIFFLLYSHESPRYNYEFSDYSSLSNFFTKVVPNNDLDKMYINPDDCLSNKGLNSEIERNNQYQKESILLEIWNKMLCFGSRKLTNQIKKQINLYEYANVSRSEILRNPFVMYNILMYDKHLRKNFLILLSLTFNIGIIHYIVTANMLKYYVSSREDLYNNLIINQYLVAFGLTILASNYLFYIVIKFFGYPVIMVISFVVIFFFSCVIEIMNLFNHEIEDLNKYTFHSSHYEYDELGRGWMNIYGLIIVFFTYGLDFCLMFYILQFTKTISRTLLIGVCRLIINIAVAMSAFVFTYFEQSYFFVAIGSVTGFIHTYFIYNDFDYSTISDFRKIEIENENNENANNKL